jgi:WD40 repeat protein
MHDVVGPNLNPEDSAWDQLVGVGMHPDGTKAIAAARNGTVWIWSTQGKLCASFLAPSGGPDPLNALEVDPLGEGIALGGPNYIGLWSWDGELITRLTPHGYKAKVLAYSPNGERLFSIADNPSGPYIAELWDRTGNCVAQLDAKVSVSTLPVFATSGEYFALPGDSATIMDFDGNQLGTLSGNERTWVTDMAVSPDAALIAALFNDGLVRTWSYATRSRRSSTRVAGGTALTFSGDGRSLVVGTATGDLRWYPLDVADLYRPCAARLNRVLSTEELERYDIANPHLTAEFLRSLIR